MCAWFTTEDLPDKEQLVTFNIKQTILWCQTCPSTTILLPDLCGHGNLTPLFREMSICLSVSTVAARLMLVMSHCFKFVSEGLLLLPDF